MLFSLGIIAAGMIAGVVLGVVLFIWTKEL